MNLPTTCLSLISLASLPVAFGCSGEPAGKTPVASASAPSHQQRSAAQPDREAAPQYSQVAGRLPLDAPTRIRQPPRQPAPGERVTARPQSPSSASLLVDGGFNQPDHAAWESRNGAAAYRPARGQSPAYVELPAGAQLHQRVEVASASAGKSYRLMARVRGHGQSGRVRFQVVWLPAGGWDAVGADGQKLVDVQAEGRPVPQQTWLKQGVVTVQSPHAVHAAIYIANDGDDTLDVTDVLFVPALR